MGDQWSTRGWRRRRSVDCAKVVDRRRALGDTLISPDWSRMSCRLPRILPAYSRSTCDEMMTTGDESAYASPTGVETLVMPGPVMISATPGLPVARA